MREGFAFICVPSQYVLITKIKAELCVIRAGPAKMLREQ